MLQIPGVFLIEAVVSGVYVQMLCTEEFMQFKIKSSQQTRTVFGRKGRLFGIQTIITQMLRTIALSSSGKVKVTCTTDLDLVSFPDVHCTHYYTCTCI